MLSGYVLDACSLIAFLRKENGGEKVRQLLQNASSGTGQIFVHKVTITEVLYDSLRLGQEPDDILETLYNLPMVIEEELSEEFIKVVANYKAFHKVSFADCFVLALAEIHNATVVSADHHEFDAIEKSGKLKFAWIR